jgi:hypothetical protein
MKILVKISKAFCILVILSLTSTLAMAQQHEFVLSKLQNKTWIMQGTTDKTIEESFTKGNIICKYNGKHVGTFEFYLSDSKDTIFDSSKKNKVENGRYIISRMVRDKSDKRPTPVSILEIIELTDEKMVLKNENNVLLEYKVQ